MEVESVLPNEGIKEIEVGTVVSESASEPFKNGLWVYFKSSDSGFEAIGESKTDHPTKQERED